MPVISPRVRLHHNLQGVSGFAPAGATEDRLSDLADFGPNPGNLRARYYVPEGLEGPAPVVVVLHGCTQNAAVYDHGSGWSTLADRHGFILLFPEQQRANNPMLCFNWFSVEDTGRGSGEAASIRSMIDGVARLHDVDPRRVFVTGLSAGGAMASVMLAAYPEIFAAGAILAGVAYGCATDVGQAFDCMSGRSQGSADELGRSVRRASNHQGPWPRVQVWQGGADHTVVPSNGDAIVRQWVDVHGLAADPNRLDSVGGFPRRAWLGAAGEPLIEHYLIPGMAHGVPLASGEADPVGAAGAHMLDVGLNSTVLIAEFFGIASAKLDRTSTAPAPDERRKPAQQPQPATRRGVQGVIEDALKAAGLMH